MDSATQPLLRSRQSQRDPNKQSKTAGSHSSDGSGRKKVLIVGAGAAGKSIREII